MWRQHCHRGHTGHDKEHFFAVASGDFRHSMCIPWEVGNHLGSMISETIKLEAPNGIFCIGVCRKTGELVLRSGWDKFVAMHHIEENCSLWFVYRGNSTFKVHIFNSNGDEKATSSQPPSQSFGGVPPAATCDHHVLNEQVLSDSGHVQTSTDSGYSVLPGCHLTKVQDEKVREIACTVGSEVPLYVAVMNKSNVNLKDCSVNLPLKLVEHFKEDTSKATVQLEAPNDNIYAVQACKHGDDQIVLQYGWNNLVDANRIQENDLLIFITKGKKRLEVRILGTSVHQRTSSCFATGNISSTQEICEHSLEITDPPPHTDYYVSSSDDDHVVEEGTRKSCGRQKQAPSHCAKTQKVASTFSPSAKSGYEAHTLNEQSSVEFRVDLEPHSSSNLEGPSQHSYILAEAGITLSAVEKKKVEEKVQAIQSELPIFVAVMTTTSHLRFCQEYASRYIPPIKEKRPRASGRGKYEGAGSHIGNRCEKIEVDS